MEQQPTQNPSGQMPGGQSQNTVMAVVAYFIFFVPLLTDAKNDPFVKYHVKQSLGLLISWFVSLVLLYFPIVQMFVPLLQLGVAILWIIGIVYAVQGKQEPVPVLGQFFEKLAF